MNSHQKALKKVGNEISKRSIIKTKNLENRRSIKTSDVLKAAN